MSREDIATKIECVLEDLEELKHKIKEIENWNIHKVYDESLRLRRFINEFIINELALIKDEFSESRGYKT
jgi:hypothetical protein